MLKRIIFQFLVQLCIADWIEISQKYQRKNVRPLNRFESPVFHPQQENIQNFGLEENSDVNKDIIHSVEESIRKINPYKNVTKGLVVRVRPTKQYSVHKNASEHKIHRTATSKFDSEQSTFSNGDIPNQRKATNEKTENPLKTHTTEIIGSSMEKTTSNSIEKPVVLDLQFTTEPYKIAPLLLDTSGQDEDVEILIVDDEEFTQEVTTNLIDKKYHKKLDGERKPDNSHEDINEVIQEKSAKVDRTEKDNLEENLKLNSQSKLTDNTTYTLNNIIRILKQVRDTIAQNSLSTLGGKTKYLNELQNSLMSAIEERLQEVWGEVGRRRRRSDHVGFPSSESALMSISFLTFAVFLIKLVMQVIHAYKNKAMVMTPTVFTAVGKKLVAHINKN